MKNSTLDSLVAGGLVLALLLVLGLDRLFPTDPTAAPIQQPSTPPAQVKPVRIGVSEPRLDDKWGTWDDMAKLLRQLGPGFSFTEVTARELEDPRTWEKFDVFFLTCSDKGNNFALTNNIKEFVAKGGTLYASDWRYKVVADAFPEYADPSKAVDGKDGHIVAKVTDQGLQDVLGTASLSLNFNLDMWKPAAFRPDKCKVLLTAKFKRQDGAPDLEAPLMVQFSFGKQRAGTVIFTSFHNEKQHSDIETKLLKYLVFNVLTAQLDAQASQNMIEGGFSPQKSNLFSASGKSAVTYAYKSTKAGDVNFALAFNEGAKLKLSVTSPDGKTKEQEGTKTFDITMSGAAPGEWRYTVTAIEVPSENFPFRVIVGEK